MSADALYACAKAAGVTIETAGDRLRLLASSPPPIELLHEIGAAKIELLALFERVADEAAERAAIMSEPELPALNTFERERLDNAQRTTLAGLILAAWQNQTQRR